MDCQQENVVKLGMSEVWADIGHRARPSKDENSKVLAMLTGFKNHRHEDNEETLSRRERNLQSIRRVFGPGVPDESTIILKALGRKIEFWPATGVWYSHSKGRYGHGIEEICQIIERELMKRNEDNDGLDSGQ